MTLENKIYALHRYFIWANKMRIDFEKLLSENSDWAFKEGIRIEARLYMSYWYAGLYVVVEGWRDLKLHDEKIDALLQSTNTELLRRYRNGVFHFKADYNDSRFEDFYIKAKEPVLWVRELNKAFGRYFLKEIKNMEARKKEQ